jgi:hypothetical protein
MRRSTASVYGRTGSAPPGRSVLFTLAGPTLVPSKLVFGGTQIDDFGIVTIHMCNTGSSAISVSNLGIRIAAVG